MKFRTPLAVVAIAAFFIAQSCSKEVSRQTATVLCERGYTGPKCDTLQRLRFQGTYQVSQLCGPDSLQYALTATSSNAQWVWQLCLVNFNNSGDTAKANITSDSTLSISTQTVGGKTVYGSGTIANNILTIDYSLGALSCKMVCTK
jgi:hypothetical protein